MPSSRSSTVLAGVITTLSLGVAALAGCSASPSSYADAAEDLIEGGLADQAGLGRLTATCNTPLATARGEAFACQADTVDGKKIDFVATIVRNKKIDVSSTNLVTGSLMSRVEEAALQLLADQTGFELPFGALDCGRVSVLLDESGRLSCTMTSPDNGDRYDASVTIVELHSANPQITNFEIAATPRN